MSFGQNISSSLTSRSDSLGGWLCWEGPPPDTQLIGRGLPVPVLFVCYFNSFMKSPRFDVGDQIRTEGTELTRGSELPQRPRARPGPRPRRRHEVTGQTVQSCLKKYAFVSLINLLLEHSPQALGRASCRGGELGPSGGTVGSGHSVGQGRASGGHRCSPARPGRPGVPCLPLGLSPPPLPFPPRSLPCSLLPHFLPTPA